MDPIFTPFEKGLYYQQEKIFIIHGHDEKNLEQLELMLYNLDLKPIILKKQISFSSKTIIEDFEFFGSKCKYCIALITPDDLVINKEHKYFQPRPNTIFE